MRNEKTHKDPLLYVHQPKSNTPSAYMQNDYVTPKKQSGMKGRKKNRISQSSMRTIKKSSYFKSRYPDDEAEEKDVISEIDEVDDSPDEPMRPPRDKKFKDMTLEEKVQYFAYAPSTSPKLRCEVKTYERSYRGKVVDYIESDVYMRVGRRISPEKIPFEEIRDIRLLGF